MRHLMAFIIVVLLFQIPCHAQGTKSEDEALTPAGAALTTIFSPSRAPKQKTMGLLQRSFLDLADQGDQELEVAIVVDGTDSMTTELAGVRRSIHQMLDDLRRVRNNEVRAAIVVRIAELCGADRTHPDLRLGRGP